MKNCFFEIVFISGVLFFLISCGVGNDNPVCGDGVVDGGEVCEIGEEIECEELGEYYGTAICNESCMGWNIESCEELVNECETDNGGCGDENYAQCEDTVESYVCSCEEPYVPTNDEKKCVPRYDTEGEKYFGDALVIVNTRPYHNYTAFSGTISTKTPSSRSLESSRKKESYFLPGKVIPLPENVTSDMRLRDNSVESETVSLGDVRKFNKFDYSSYGYEAVEATAQYVGEECIIWTEDTKNPGISDAEELGREFDDVIFSLITENFYHPSDVDGNGKVFIFFADLGGQAGGYFNPMDLYDTEDSNFADMFYIEKRLVRYGLSYVAPVLAHEFQHLVHNNRKSIEENGDIRSEWIAEGLSTSAEHAYSGFRESWLNAYNSSSSVSNGVSLFNFDYRTNSDVGASYALTYMFHQYFRIQTGKGFPIYREFIMHESNSEKAYEDLVRKYVDKDMNFSDFMTSFRIAMLAKRENGLYGFLGEDGFDRVETPWYQGSGKEIGGGGALYVQIDGFFEDPGDKDEYIEYIGVTLGEKASFSSEEYISEKEK